MANTTGVLTDLGRAHHMLEGILKGIGADNVFSLEEAAGLKKWLDLHLNLIDLSPFKELYELTSQALNAGLVEADIEEEILLFCHKFTSENGVADSTSKDIRVLHGIMQGITIDGEITEDEAFFLKKWAEVYAPAEKIFPYSDLLILLNRVLADGRIDPDEHTELMTFCRDFSERLNKDQDIDLSIGDDGPWMQSKAPVLNTIEQVCDPTATVEIPGRCFCFTGQAAYGSRADLQFLTEHLSGITTNNIIKHLDYLVVGAKSSPCWMYSTYGRKIEKALAFNADAETEKPIIIIHENIFIDAVKTMAPEFLSK